MLSMENIVKTCWKAAFSSMSFAEHVKKVLEMPQVTAHLVALPAICTAGHTVESLTALVQQKMVQGLADLHHKVLKSQPNMQQA
jgi:lyso-ornithine lipid O-acyltransferase